MMAMPTGGMAFRAAKVKGSERHGGCPRGDRHKVISDDFVVMVLGKRRGPINQPTACTH
jgi:hypothetical protein